MLDSVFIGITGLNGFSRGLKVIANNTANMNTPGFKGSSLDFGSLYYSQDGGSGGTLSFGHGLSTLGTSVSFASGDIRQTGNSLDLAIDGNGFIALRLADGSIRYTRAGELELNAKGELVQKQTGAQVLAAGGSDSQVISVAGLRSNAPKATATINLAGNLSTGSSSHTIPGVQVFDAAGGEHVLTLQFDAIVAEPGSWTVTLTDGATTVGTGKLTFASGAPTAGTQKLSMTYSPAQAPTQTLTLDFAKDVTSFAAGASSTLATSGQDGYGLGSVASVTFDQVGQLVLTYTNGQTAKGGKLRLGRFESEDAVKPVGSNLFEVVRPDNWRVGEAGGPGFGLVRAGSLEMSNVDLTQEFSNLVIVQRGYQASSQVVTTANEMLEKLFGLNGR